MPSHLASTSARIGVGLGGGRDSVEGSDHCADSAGPKTA
eukprot:CAMPEP_0198516404 /NCGR_PEP_ID=MMETSP1462-20131121/17895_1 /TAXON_ID=1333877 /ORGANISM="Brandtodinium nutriculum, Strain RCC3387" /LENGTH=38 /DNA_ID= /DNA_START= /DNA_END= /DNA_ORIENTATION=